MRHQLLLKNLVSIFAYFTHSLLVEESFKREFGHCLVS